MYKNDTLDKKLINTSCTLSCHYYRPKKTKMFSFGIKLLVHSAFICITFGIEDSTNCTDLLALRNSLLQALDNVTTLLAADCTSQSELDNSILPRDCQDIKELGHHETGEYTIRPIMATDGFKVPFTDMFSLKRLLWALKHFWKHTFLHIIL